LASEEGKKVTFNNVLLLDDNGKITIGAPAIDGAAVEAKVIKHLKGDKVIVFKKKRRKGYRVKNGHRQSLTEITIEGITASGAKKAAPKAKAEKKAVVKTEKPAAKAEKAAPAPKKAEAKKEETKKAPVAKKTAVPKKAKADDLKKVEGIGPKIAETLIAAGIVTFADLAKTKPAKISEIIAGVRGNHIPDTWPKQAKLAADGLIKKELVVLKMVENQNQNAWVLRFLEDKLLLLETLS